MLFPPGPKLNQGEQLQLLRRTPLRFFDDCHQKFGRIFTLNLGTFGNQEVDTEANGKWVFITRPEDVETLFKTSPEIAMAGVANKMLFGSRTQQGGIIRLDGREHMNIRRVYQPIFNGNRMRAYTLPIMATIRRHARLWSRSRAFPMLPEMQRITIDVIAKSILGFDESELFDMLCSRLMCLENAAIQGRDRHMAERELSRIIHEHIATNRTTDLSDREDVFSRLCQLTKPDGLALTDKELHDELVTLLKAGFGTTSNALAWLFACILEKETVRARIQEEAMNAVGGREPAKCRFDQMPYTEAVIQETLRLCPSVAGFTGVRYLSEPLRLGGYTIPAHTVVAIATHILHRDASVYPDPLLFKPERFLTAKPSAWRWAPFGGGNRMCVGRSFAMHEMKVVLATLFSDMEINLDRPVGGSEVQGFFCSPKDRGPHVRIKDRSHDEES
ncbi:cytochrome P450 [Acanthopleuribacter pedis]|uniref:Cytochrome P450 n=1 Tax=Acanthopleuribacter pedis TaxID=442870 RepID=A0A8J7QPC4_9BACT|nr:cytochrome P450 [Acanthopleuribacter pedis]MBO1322178.1 cytochrome P450 [Acanthopleuribacter pedis]